jgi:FkbH-like protein
MSKPCRVRFIRNFTLEPIEIWLQRELKSSGISVACSFGGFSEAADDIQCLAAEGQETDGHAVTVLALGLELTARDFGHVTWAVEAACERHLLLVRSAVEHSRVPLVINTVLPPLFSATGLASVSGDANHAEYVDKLNLELRNIAAVHSGRVVLVDWTAIARELGERHTYDYRFWYSSGAPFASAFLGRYAAAIAAVVRVSTGKVRKCLVLDCDNTLWGGIVGEDGREGVQLSSDTLPGAYFQAFQRSVLDLHARGVIIALCSKNDASDVLDVIDNHPDCVLRREHVAAWRINWNEKSQSIAELADELNIGRDAMVFIDDSAHECELVRSIHTEVLVLQTPARHEDLVNFLRGQHLFDSLVVTSDDVMRSRTYQQNRARGEFSAVLGDISEYKRRLATRLTFRHARRADLPRVVQLIQRTNQFNLTTRRHDQATVERLLESPEAMVLCVELEDRFGQLGLVGVAIAVRQDELAVIDSMLMSCRALGRDAEMAFAAALYSALATDWGVERVLADYLPTAKNQLVADFWQRAGLAIDPRPNSTAGGVRYASANDLLSLAASIMPAHVTLSDASNGY